MIASQLEVIEQAKSYLSQVSRSSYSQIVDPFFMSSAGSHVRHIIDHYLCLKSGWEYGLVDYDKRSRGGEVEVNPEAALMVLADISLWLNGLKDVAPKELTQPLNISTEVSLNTKVIEQVPSSLARELIFVGSHAVHHFAMIGQIVQHQEDNANITLPSGFGVAPATASFIREN